MKKSVQFSVRSLGLFFLALSAVRAQAGIGTSLMETAGVRPPGEIEVKAQADVIFSSKVNPDGGSGFNFSPHIVTGIVEHYVDIDAFVGTGSIDFQGGALAKFNLLPDLDNQVGLAFLGGLSYLHDSVGDVSLSGVLLSLGVLVSKTFKVDFGAISPYAAYQFEPFFWEQETIYPHTLVLGTKWDPASAAPWGFYSELSISLHRSVYGLSVGLSHTF
ncbi:MAG: hypothetical protein JST16_03230 [Bdellovibrionales bacterium]|nr:hypothetical protein [Bdellovibrionales bacterium]